MREAIIVLLYLAGYALMLMMFTATNRPITRTVLVRSVVWPVLVVVILAGLALVDASQRLQEWLYD